MKVQDFAYQVASHTIELLEQTQHYKIPEPVRKEICQQVVADLDRLIKSSK